VAEPVANPVLQLAGIRKSYGSGETESEILQFLSMA